MAEETLPLLSADHKSELECHVVAETKVGGERYVLLTPTRPWLVVVRDDEEGVTELDTAEVEPLIPRFNEALAQHSLSIEVRSDELLLNGKLTDEVKELCDTIGVNDEDEDDAHLILADVEVKDVTYLLLSPELPAMFAAKVKDGKGYPLSDKELAKVEDKLEAALVQRS